MMGRWLGNYDKRKSFYFERIKWNWAVTVDVGQVETGNSYYMMENVISSRMFN